MRLLKPVEYPANRPAGRWVFDVLVTLLAFALAVPNLFNEGTERTPAAALVVLAVITGPLVVRRIWPVPVFGWVLAAQIPAFLWDTQLIALLALLISLYTVARLQSRRETLACAGILEIAAVAGLLLLDRDAARRPSDGPWVAAIFVSALIAAALGLGLYVGTRRAYLAELRDRADRLERERDQQAALAAAAERARIAREMHDIVAHHLTVMVTLSEAAIAASASSPERANDVMRSVADTGRRALADTRRLLGVLRQRPGEESGQEAAGALQPVPDLTQLDRLIEQVRSAGLDTTLEIGGQVPDVPAGVQLTVYRLVQEALTNTLKHGGPAARASVRLSYLPGELLVDIDDDGAGLTAPATADTGGGLLGMRERVHAYGGDVWAGPRQPGGWRVSARLRLDGSDAS
jgi:signal transduction histidine kinase